MKTAIAKFLKDEEGATAIEYGLLAGIVAVGLIAALNSLEGGLTGLFNRIATTLSGLGGSSGGGT